MSKEIEFLVMNWEASYNACHILFEQIKHDKYIPDLIIGVARGGWIPGRLLADFFTIKATANMKVEAYEMIGEMGVEAKITQDIGISVEGKKILIIDDIADSGASMQVVVDNLSDRGVSEIRTATIYYKERSKIIPDYFHKKTEAWVIFPWEYFETIQELHTKFAGEGLDEHQIKQKLRNIGIPAGMIEAYYISI